MVLTTYYDVCLEFFFTTTIKYTIFFQKYQQFFSFERKKSEMALVMALRQFTILLFQKEFHTLC